MDSRVRDVASSDALKVTGTLRSSLGPFHVFLLLTLALAGALLLVVFLQPKLAVGSGVLLAVTGMGLMAALVAEFVRPFVLLVLTLAFLSSPFPLLLDNTWSALITGSLLGITSLALALRSGFSRITLNDRTCFFCWAFLFYGSLSAARGILAGNRLDWVVGDAFQIAEFALVYILVNSLVTSRETLYALLKWVGLVAVFNIVFELILPFVGLSWLLPSWEGTVSRTINMGAMFVLVLFLNLCALGKFPIPAPWIWILVALPALNILFSLTRGLWLGSIIAVGTSAFLLTGKTRWKVLSIFAGIACCLLLSAAAVQIGSGSVLNVFEERVTWGESQVQKALTGEESLATRRFMEFVIISPELVTAPVLGKGLGAQYAIGSFAIADPGDVDVIDHHYIHNLFLMVSFRMGIVGLLFFGGILFCFFRRALKACGRLPNGLSRAFVAGLIGSVLGQLALSMTWPTILDHPTAGIVGCAMALTFVICRLEMKEQAADDVENYSSNISQKLNIEI